MRFSSGRVGSIITGRNGVGERDMDDTGLGAVWGARAEGGV
jgi:hypothetical protein